MHQSPEGLEYSTDNYKYAKTPINDDWKEKGKLAFKNGVSTRGISTIQQEASHLPNTLHCSEDPYYKDSKKNR